MTFTFLDRVAEHVGDPAELVAGARACLFREPVRHDGLRRLPREDLRTHVGGLVAREALARLRGPFETAVEAHAAEAGDLHEMTTGDEPGSDGYRAAVIAAFEGNDCGIDLAALPVGGVTPAAAADQVLVVPDDPAVLGAFLARAGVDPAAVEALVDEVFMPPAPAAPIEWSLAQLAALIAGLAPTSAEEIARSLFSSDVELRVTGFDLLGHENASLDEWLDERAAFSSPESDEADVAEILRLVNEKGGGSHNGTGGTLSADAGDKAAAGAEPLTIASHIELPADSTGTQVTEAFAGLRSAPAARLAHPVAAEPSDLTRAVAGALRALFELTKETDTHVAEVLGVPKAVVAQARKDVTPWEPGVAEYDTLERTLRGYVTGLSDALKTLQENKI